MVLIETYAQTVRELEHVEDYKVYIRVCLYLKSNRISISMEYQWKVYSDSRLLAINAINLKEAILILKDLMFQTLLMTHVSTEYEHPPLTSVVVTVKDKADLNKADDQSVELPEKISGSLNERAELITTWKLLSIWSHRTDRRLTPFIAVAVENFLVKEVSRSHMNRFVSHKEEFFSKNSLVTV